jgi:predicted O-methyltransferase YrrM
MYLDGKGSFCESLRMNFAKIFAKYVLRRLFGRRVIWSYMTAYKQPMIQVGQVPIEPIIYVVARSGHAGMSAVHRSLVRAAQEPTGLLSEFAKYRGEPSDLMVDHDPYGQEAATPLTAAEDYNFILTGRVAGQQLPPDADRFSTQRFLYFLVRELKPQVVLELGTAHGLSALHLIAALEANRSGHLHTVELDSTRRTLALEAFERFFPQTKRLTSLEASFADALPGLAAELARLDLVFEDGPHTHDVTLEAFRQTIDYLEPGGVYVVDDIEFSGDQERAWVSIRNDPRVAASLEINGRCGVCFRAG